MLKYNARCDYEKRKYWINHYVSCTAFVFLNGNELEMTVLFFVPLHKVTTKQLCTWAVLFCGAFSFRFKGMVKKAEAASGINNKNGINLGGYLHG
ncbi:hypothetical protein [Sinobaca sp. H24]|uniref:hypothetical protein n=1 Tax=Sinobaca sp. H24 TaxID=2923376 RepID=UPI00207AA664|nr:hypothetical protein [Sinobaca sp. H24]